MLHRMKVTALIPDEIVDEVSAHASGKNLTESLVIALQEWIELKKLNDLNKRIDANPFEFRKGYSSAKIRHLNRRRQ